MRRTLFTALLTFASLTTLAQTPTYTGTPGDYIAHDFHFTSGESLPELKLHYLTLGTPHRNAHGHGDSSKPSDGLRMHFPRYDYDDMVRSQHQMLLDGLHVDHLRLILGTSMGCMQSFVWGETYPDFADALMPLACLPVPLAGRNRMMRYMAIENIENDPAWNHGDYTTEPTVGLRTANEMLLIMGSAPLVMQKQYPTRAAAETFVDNYLTRTTAATDANNLIYYVNASRNYDPSPHLDHINIPVMWINSADDFINPPELGIAENLVHTMPNARFVLLPITDQTRGHGTHTIASIWQNYLIQLLKESAPKP
jgi:homoserine O-acetyltransferase